MINLILSSVAAFSLFGSAPEEKPASKGKELSVVAKNTSADKTITTAPKKKERGHAYASFRTGMNFLHAYEKRDIKLKTKVGYAVGGAAGYRWRNGINLEAEYLYRSNSVYSVEFLENPVRGCASVMSSSYLANFVYMIPYSFSLCKITPYFGGGIGYVHQHASACPYDMPSGEKGGFGWQVIGGFKQKLWNSFELAADYRFSKGPLNYLHNQNLIFSFTYLF